MSSKPFPECYNDCEIVRHLGVGECENICFTKFDRYGDPIKECEYCGHFPCGCGG